MLGALGEFIFHVSDEYIFTFQDLQFSRQAGWAEHKILGRDTLLEFTGFGAQTCSMKIVLDVSFGFNPKKQLEQIREMFTKHEANLFVLDGQLVGSGYWVIESMNENIERVDNFGGVQRVEVSLNMKEYREL